jgi:rubrerythrin
MTTEITRPLEFVLDFEAKGAGMYLKLARETKQPLGKKLFYSLAAEEVEHAQKADNIFQAIEGKGTAGEASEQKLPAIEKVMKDFFERSADKDLKTERQDLAGYELAMEMEREGYKAYAAFHAEATDPKEKEFFSRILKEEKEHIDALANVYAYLTDTDDWMQKEESKVWNWMNL